MSESQSKVWICWENHRRSRELAKGLDAEFCLFSLNASRFIRYPYLIFRTVFFVLNKNPDIVFCQNPSIVLTFFLSLMRKIMRFRLVVDRHSNFKMEYSRSNNIKWKIFHWLSRYTVKASDLTIVTNGFLKELVERLGGEAFILEDKVPDMFLASTQNPPYFRDYDTPYFHVMVVSTFSSDEPISQIIEASRELPSDFRVYLTGNYRKKFSVLDVEKLKESGIILTGFISEEEYQALMHYSDVIVILTLKNDILNCGSYEAVALERPMILSDTKIIRNYFRSGCLYTRPTKDDIFKNILLSKEVNNELKSDLVEYKPYLVESWSKKFDRLKYKIGCLD
jgi:hypothetical protein